MRTTRILILGLSFLVLAAAPATAHEEQTDGKQQSERNVLVTITMGKLEQGNKVAAKSYRLVVPDGGGTAELMIGSRVPIPVTTFNTANANDGQIVPMTSYTYQNVGFSAVVRAWIRGDRITLAADIEDSRVRAEAGGTDQPEIETAHGQIHAVFAEGRPLEVFQRHDAGNGSGYVEIEATLLE